MRRTLKMKLTSVGLTAALALIGLTLPTPTRAENVQNIQMPITLSVFVPCANGGAGEGIQVSGDLHIVLNITIDNGGNIHLKTHAQPQGVSGFGLITGDKYQGTGVTQNEQTITSGGGEFTFVNNFRMIGQGPGNNFSIHENVHVTVNANGDVTATQDNFNTDCK